MRNNDEDADACLVTQLVALVASLAHPRPRLRSAVRRKEGGQGGDATHELLFEVANVVGQRLQMQFVLVLDDEILVGLLEHCEQS